MVYATVALGLAATSEGGTFEVSQAEGYGVYEYTVVGGAARFDSVALISAEVAALRAAEAAVTAPITGLLVSGWGSNAHEWDGRVVPNEVAATPPTLNILPDPFNPADEDGGSTPARSINDSGITDPDGGQNALKITATAQNQQLGFINVTDDVLPTTDYVVRAQTILVSGGAAFRIGGVSANKADFTATGAWEQQVVALTGFANSVALGVSSAPGNSTGVLGVYNAQIFDTLLSGTVYPAPAAEKAALKWHAKRPAAYRQSLTFDAFRALDHTTETDGVILGGHPTLQTLAAGFAMGVWVKATAEPTSVYGNALSFDFHTSNATVTSGQVGIVGTFDAASPHRYGRMYANPNVSFLTLKTGHYLVGEGWQHLAVSNDAGVTTFYINGVPILEQSVPSWAAPTFARLILGNYNGIPRRRKVAQIFTGYLQGWWFIDRPVTQAEMIQQDQHGRERIEALGDEIGERKVLWLAGTDSNTAFQPSYFWHLCQDRTLSPRMHAMCEAAGGTDIADWWARRAFALRQAQAGIDAGYLRIVFLLAPGANEIIDWVQGDYDGLEHASPPGGRDEWMVDFATYIAEFKALGSKVKAAVLTMLPRATTLGVVYSAEDLGSEQVRQAHNDDLRDNFADYGIDYLIDAGLGTERIDASGVVTAELLSGGTIMGNYRSAAGCVTNSRQPAATITFSALSGASFTGTTPAGTFTSQDVGRKITGIAGSADIIDVNGDGSVATLSTTGYAPTPYPAEPAGSVTRDTIARVAFGSLSYNSTEWSVVNAVSYYGIDGIHYSEPGGRLVCDVVASSKIGLIQDEAMAFNPAWNKNANSIIGSGAQA